MEKLKKINDGMKYFAVAITPNAMGEDGKPGHDGYAVLNKETGFSEFTSMSVVAAIFQAQHFDSMLKGLLDEEIPDVPEWAGGDIVPIN
jgi:hypothetical protein